MQGALNNRNNQAKSARHR